MVKMEYLTLVVLLLLQRAAVFALTGHVCTRQRAEQYMTSYNRGFICPERYTTACGQLDWRRCTKYRVQTCYTPTERYATRYITVEECCPGWRDGGAGKCIIPVCDGGCQNGGSCSDDVGMPGCSCLDGFHGDRCQIERNSTDTRELLLICVLAVTVIFLVVGVVVFFHRWRKEDLKAHSGRKFTEEIEMTQPLMRQENGNEEERVGFRPITWIPSANPARQPSAPVLN